MTALIFYGKVGCSNNSKQKQVLIEAGFEVIAKNILTEHWQAETLRQFFGDLTLNNWFNPSAPAIKYGEIDIESLDETAAIELMLANPLLIRRPLIQIGSDYIAGFDLNKISTYLPLTNAEDIPQSCSHSHDKEHKCREH